MPTKTVSYLSRRYFYSTQYVDSNLTLNSSTLDNFGWSNTITGVGNPLHRRQIAFGQNATTVASSNSARYRPGYGHAELEWEVLVAGGHWERHLQIRSGAILGTVARPTTNVSAYTTSQADTQARLRFLQKYRSQRTAFTGGTILGELGETLRMLKSPAQALRRGIDDYYGAAKERLRRIAKHKRSAALRETYLEYTFGWRPLISDINSIAETLRHGPDSYRQVITAHSDDIKVNTFDVLQASVTDGMDIRFNRNQIGKVTVRYKGAVNAGFERPPSLLEFSGVGLSNFVPTVWELIPYSFLVDYFVNIGNVIDAASLGTVSLSWGCCTTRKSFETLLSGGRVQFNSSGRLIHRSVSLSGFQSENSISSRVPVSGIDAGIADIQFRVPGVDSPWKWLNIGALASKRKLPFTD